MCERRSAAGIYGASTKSGATPPLTGKIFVLLEPLTHDKTEQTRGEQKGGVKAFLGTRKGILPSQKMAVHPAMPGED